VHRDAGTLAVMYVNTALSVKTVVRAPSKKCRHLNIQYTLGYISRSLAGYVGARLPSRDSSPGKALTNFGVAWRRQQGETKGLLEPAVTPKIASSLDEIQVGT